MAKLRLTIRTKVRLFFHFSFFELIRLVHEKLSRSQPIVTSANTQSYSVVEPHLDPEVLQTSRIRPNWTLNDIFYANERDDYIKSVEYRKKIFIRNRLFDFLFRILSRTSVSGTFLIRPQSKKSSGNDHDYVRQMRKARREKKTETFLFRHFVLWWTIKFIHFQFIKRKI